MMNGEWLFPNTRRGWVAAIILAVMIFFLYYSFIFPHLLQFHQTVLYAAPIEVEAKAGGPVVRIDEPESIAALGIRWVYITIRNRGTEPIRDVRVWPAPPPKRESSLLGNEDVWILPYLFGSSTVAERSVGFEEIPAHATLSGRIPLFASQRITRVLWISWSDQSGSEHLSSLLDEQGHVHQSSWEANSVKSLVHTFVEYIMLPPWSNGFIILSILILCALVDRAELDEEKFGVGEWGWWLSTAVVTIDSLRFMFGVSPFVLALVALPWLSIGVWQSAPLLLRLFGAISCLLLLICVALSIRGYQRRYKGTESDKHENTSEDDESSKGKKKEWRWVRWKRWVRRVALVVLLACLWRWASKKGNTFPEAFLLADAVTALVLRQLLGVVRTVIGKHPAYTTKLIGSAGRR